MAIILINKKEGETPLEALQYFRSRNKIYKEAKMTYAGRLDPMAKGLLLVLVGEETKKKARALQVKNISIFLLLNFNGVFGLVRKEQMAN